MLPTTGYFKTIPCPFFDNGFCERPFCHFKHVKPDGEETLPSKEDEVPEETTSAEETSNLEDNTADSSKSSSVSIAASASGQPGSAGILAAASGTLSGITAGLQPDKLESLIQEAVRKVLLGEGKANLPAQELPKVKEEVDDDIIVDYCDIKSDKNVKTEVPARNPDPKPKLFLPPPGTPVYTPTPLSELEKRRSLDNQSQQDQDLQQAPMGSFSPPTEDAPQTSGGSLSSGLLEVSNLSKSTSLVKPKSNKGRKTFSYKPNVGTDSVLGDIGDMSESEEETQTPDILGNILKEGNNSGVLSGGLSSNFEEEVIKERWKKLKKKLDKDEEDETETAKEAEKDEDQCDKVSSSVLEESVQVDPVPVVEKEETKEEREARLLKEEEEEIRKLEEKRLILENFYKSRMKEIEKQKSDPSKEKKDVKDTKSDDLQKSKSKEDRKSSDGSKSKEGSRLHKQSKHNSSKKKSRSRRSRSRDRRHSSHKSSKSSKSSRRSKSRKSSKRHRSRRDTTSDTSDSEDSDSSSDSGRERRHRRKEKKDRKHKSERRRHHSSSSESEVTETDFENEKKDEAPEKPAKHSKPEASAKASTEVPADIEYSEFTQDGMLTKKEDISDEPMDDFKRAELKIKQLLEMKMKGPANINASPQKPVDLKPTVKQEVSGMKVPVIDTSSETCKETKDSDQPAVKPEIKLKPLSDLAGSVNVIDPKTKNIFDEDETFSEMIRRHKASWQNDQDDESIGIHSPEDSGEAWSTTPNMTPFLDALSSADQTFENKEKKKDNKEKRNRSSSKSDRHSRDHKKQRKEDDERRKEHKRRPREREKSRKSHKEKRSKHEKNEKDRRSKEHSKKPTEPSQSAEKDADEPDRAGSPMPDISAELDMLPDLGEDDIDAGMDAIFGGIDEDADDAELQRIFQDYKADAQPSKDPARAKLNQQAKPSSTEPSGGKKRIAYEGARDQAENKRPLHMKKPQLKTPAQALMERYKKLQAMRQQSQIEKRLSEITSDEVPGTSSSADGPRKDRIAHQPKNAPAVLSKTKQQLLARQSSQSTDDKSEAGPSTTAQTSKGKSRVAHTPTAAAATRPVVVHDPNSKVPNKIRQNYLNSMVEECLKIYGGDELQSYPRAEKEEQDCCRKASSRMIYLNLAVNKIKKLRTEAAKAAEQSGESSDKGPTETGKRNLLTTHMQVLAGRPGTIGTWSIEKKIHLTDEDIDEEMLYGIMRNHVLTEEQLVDNGFPRPDPKEEGKAVLKVDPTKTANRPKDPDKRKCDRCNTIYRVDKFGMQIDQEECLYHWGRIYRKRGDRAQGGLSQYYCCQQGSDSTGCQVGKYHVTDVLDYNNMRGFVATMEKRRGTGKVFALDCEMCNTTQGNELTRVTVIDHKGEVCYETLVKPENEIIDYNTRFSGITAEDLKDVSTTLYQVQAVLLMKFDAKDILIGHSLESDLKALKILHGTVVDTSVVFPHKMGPPYKRALKFLAADHLKRIIQSDEGGHDSKEDALACLDLMKMKVREEVRRLQKRARLAAMHSSTP